MGSPYWAPCCVSQLCRSVGRWVGYRSLHLRRKFCPGWRLSDGWGQGWGAFLIKLVPYSIDFYCVVEPVSDWGVALGRNAISYKKLGGRRRFQSTCLGTRKTCSRGPVKAWGWTPCHVPEGGTGGLCIRALRAQNIDAWDDRDPMNKRMRGTRANVYQGGTWVRVLYNAESQSFTNSRYIRSHHPYFSPFCHERDAWL